MYLPPYSPDYNPVEESFGIVKNFIREEGKLIRHSNNMIRDLYECCTLIDSDVAEGLFRHDNYI